MPPRLTIDDLSAGAIKSASHAPWKGAGSLPGVSKANPRNIAINQNAPWQGRGELLQPLPGCVSLFPFYPGARFAHPRLISSRPAGAEYVTLFTKRDSHFNYTPPWRKPCGGLVFLLP